jgi:glyoxylase-like metal-dependent hydrolase (beta-lactamase superfamily II)
VRAVALHPDVLVVTSALLQVNCVIVRGGPAADGDGGDETFVIDSPVLPDELDALPALVEQAEFPAPSGLLATHGDWDHLLGRLAFGGLALGVAESTARRLATEPGAAQRELRAFDEALYVDRSRPLALGSVQALPVPGICGLGGEELELHPAEGHTADGMAIWIGWAGVLVAGDYISAVEIPTFADGGSLAACLVTLERLRPLMEAAERVVPGHGPVLGSDRALTLLEEDVAYLRGLDAGDDAAALPPGRRGRANRRMHAGNVEARGPSGDRAGRGFHDDRAC